VAIFFGLLMSQRLQAAPVPVWFDGFDTVPFGAGVSDINHQIGLPRQGGAPAPLSYVTNTANPANDYRHQLGFGPLLIAGDAGLFGVDTKVSPNHSFKGLVPGSGIVGKRVTVDLDVGILVQGSSASYTQAGITVGGITALLSADAASHFHVRFVEDIFGGNGPFIQLFDGNNLVGNLIAHPAGTGLASVQLDIEDLVDGNPWDGVGSTTIDVSVNSVLVGSFTKGGGGYTDNFITLNGSANFNGFALSQHLFDNLTVWADQVPEPTTALLVCVAGCGLLMRRQ
jgi:hypothetical protein